MLTCNKSHNINDLSSLCARAKPVVLRLYALPEKENHGEDFLGIHSHNYFVLLKTNKDITYDLFIK